MWHPNKWWLKTNSVFQGVDLYNSQILKVFPTIFHHFKIWHLTACNSTILINLKEGGGGAGHNIKEKRRQNAEIALGNGYFRPLGHSKLCAGGRSENLWRDKEKNNAFFKKRFCFWRCLNLGRHVPHERHWFRRPWSFQTVAE